MLPTPPTLDTSDLGALRRSVALMLVFTRTLLWMHRTFGGIPNVLIRALLRITRDLDTAEDTIFALAGGRSYGEVESEPEANTAALLASTDHSASIPLVPATSWDPVESRNTEIGDASGYRPVAGTSGKTIEDLCLEKTGILIPRRKTPPSTDQSCPHPMPQARPPPASQKIHLIHRTRPARPAARAGAPLP
jgi:hypothetical protein